MITISDEAFSYLFIEAINPRHKKQLRHIRETLHQIVKENRVRKIARQGREIKERVNPLVWLGRHIKWAYFDFNLQGLKTDGMVVEGVK